MVRQSDRYRSRWVRLVSEDVLYDERTIEQALELIDDYYDPRAAN
ncbi:phage NrS-1 polymerase family protein [Haloplanus aerogenes]